MAAVAGFSGRNVGVIGERKRREFHGGAANPAATTNQKQKRIFKLPGDISFELDIKYLPHKLLGNGAYGVVCCCVNWLTNQSFAIKKIADVFSHSSIAFSTLREMQILRQIRHENLISINDVMLSSPSMKSDFRDVYLVQELMDFDLHHFIQSTSLSADHCRLFLFQILNGLNYLHAANVIHRDLKPQNILLKQKNQCLKICDFGLARTKGEDSQIMTEYVVTRWYRSPELVIGSDSYGNEVDMWSAGCIFAEMLGGGKPLFPGKDAVSQLRLFHKVLGTQSDLSFITFPKVLDFLKHLPYSSGMCFQTMFPQADPLAVDLLKKMLVFDPRKRISAKQALLHPYFQDIYDPLITDTSGVEPIRIEIDEINPGAVDENLVRDLMWTEMLFYTST